MDEFVRILLLAVCGIGAIIFLIVTYLWYFVFGRSLRGILMAGLGVLMNRDMRIDLDDDPELTKRPQNVRQEMPHEIDALDFQSSLSTNDQYVPQAHDDEDGFGAQAIDAKPLKQDLVSSSFEEGRFRRLTKALSRPFLRMRMSPQSDVPAKNLKQQNDAVDNK